MLPRTLLVLALSCALAAPAFAQTGTLEKIRRDGTITLGYIENAAPFSSVDAETTYEVTVQLDDGSYRVVRRPDGTLYGVGDRVRWIGRDELELLVN